jgi:hypothetical protein
MPTQLFAPDESYGKLTINSIDMHTYAWNVVDIRPLWIPAEYRLSNVLVGHQTGRRAAPYRIDQARHQLPMKLTGVVNSAGSAYANRFAGLYQNLWELKAGIMTPPAAPTAGLAATIVLPVGASAGTIAATVQVLGVLTRPTTPQQQNPYVHDALLDIVVPSGFFS